MSDDDRYYSPQLGCHVEWGPREDGTLSTWQIAALIFGGLLVVLLAMSTDTIV